VKEVLLFDPVVHQDERGFLYESWRLDKSSAAGLPAFVQDNHTRSRTGVLRGLHYQLRQPQGKLIRVTSGTILDVAADIRRGSPTFGQWMGVVLSAENRRQIYVPPGFAHGFSVLEGPADVLYRCSAYYEPADERGVRWDDPTLSIDWRIGKPRLSPKDGQLPFLLPDRVDLPAFVDESR
jgi:dTDP-4-dehydrorhamnose 3,5-epimerase